jgi:hypothetical protein
LANLFLFPVAGIAFFMNHRREAKYPMILLVFGFGLAVVLIFWISR